jgi:(E)-4-hydroxy-3-methylbut-2-enyl-diphosphate synthase
MTLSVIGCVVNGPGEARETDIGFTGGGNGTHQVYISGLPDHRLKDRDVVDHLVELVERKAAEIEATEIEAAGTKDDAGSLDVSTRPAAAAS